MVKNKAVTLLVSVVIAFALWLYVVSVVSPGWETTIYDIPVTLMNEDALTARGLMVTSGRDYKINLKLSGNRADLSKLNKDNISLVADLSKIYQTGQTNLTYSTILPGDVPNDAATVEYQTSRTIPVTVERQVTKAVPVYIDYVGTVMEGYLADKENAILNSETISVIGPASMVDDITQARFQVDLEGRMESFSETYSFVLSNDQGEAVEVENVNLVKTDIGEVTLSLIIQPYKEIPLKLQVVNGGGATEQTTTISIEPQTIVVTGSEELLKDLDELIIGTVNLAELTEDMAPTAYPINLDSGITNLSSVFEATVSITFPNLLKQTFTVTDVVFVNVPAGMETELVTKQLEVTLRGPRALVSAMTADNVTLRVDMTGATAGIDAYKATVVLDGRYQQEVGALGSYSITAKLKEKEGN